jgi:hypothetical protein
MPWRTEATQMDMRLIGDSPENCGDDTRFRPRQAGADADPHLQPTRCSKLADSGDNGQAGPNGPLCIILVRLR